MSSLYLLQFACVIVCSLLALMLLLSRFQVRWLNRRYETSRWLLFTALCLLTLHYGLQMCLGFRAQSDKSGVVYNILFYTPASFLISYAVWSIVCSKSALKRYGVVGGLAYLATLVTFFVGHSTDDPGGRGLLFYVMYALFVCSIVFFVVMPFREMRRRRRLIENNTGGDIMPYVRYMWASIIFLFVAGLMLTVAMLDVDVLYVLGPVVLLSLFVFVQTFVTLGLSLLPTAEVVADDDENDCFDEPQDIDKQDEQGDKVNQNFESIENALQEWVKSKGFTTEGLTLSALTSALGGVNRGDLTYYFERHLHTTFRVWLSELRLAEAKRLMAEHPEYSNDAVSSACGFSSRAQLYNIFRDREQMSPGEWKARAGLKSQGVE